MPTEAAASPSFISLGRVTCALQVLVHLGPPALVQGAAELAVLEPGCSGARVRRNDDINREIPTRLQCEGGSLFKGQLCVALDTIFEYRLGGHVVRCVMTKACAWCRMLTMICRGWWTMALDYTGEGVAMTRRTVTPSRSSWAFALGPYASGSLSSSLAPEHTSVKLPLGAIAANSSTTSMPAAPFGVG